MPPPALPYRPATPTLSVPQTPPFSTSISNHSHRFPAVFRHRLFVFQRRYEIRALLGRLGDDLRVTAVSSVSIGAAVVSVSPLQLDRSPTPCAPPPASLPPCSLPVIPAPVSRLPLPAKLRPNLPAAQPGLRIGPPGTSSPPSWPECGVLERVGLSLRRSPFGNAAASGLVPPRLAELSIRGSRGERPSGMWILTGSQDGVDEIAAHRYLMLTGSPHLALPSFSEIAIRQRGVFVNHAFSRTAARYPSSRVISDQYQLIELTRFADLSAKSLRDSPTAAIFSRDRPLPLGAISSP